MFSVGTSLRLPVPIGRVWRLLVDIERYDDWHPTLRFTDRPGDDERVGYVYSPRGKRGPEFASEGRITGLDWLTGFSWRTGTRGLLVIGQILGGSALNAALLPLGGKLSLPALTAAAAEGDLIEVELYRHLHP